MWTAFPSSDYYEGSVAIGVSPRRQSRVPLTSRMVWATVHDSVSIDELTPLQALGFGLLGDLVFALVFGTIIGLVRWASQSQAATAQGTDFTPEWSVRNQPDTHRGHPLGFVLRWIGILIGLFMLKFLTDWVWTLLWLGF